MSYVYAITEICILEPEQSELVRVYTSFDKAIDYVRNKYKTESEDWEVVTDNESYYNAATACTATDQVMVNVTRTKLR